MPMRKNQQSTEQSQLYSFEGSTGQSRGIPSRRYQNWDNLSNRQSFQRRHIPEDRVDCAQERCS